MAATARLSSIAASASGLVTASQKVVPPCLTDVHTSAAIGRATTTLMNSVTKPSERAPPALSPSLRVSTPPRGAGAAMDELGSRASNCLLDLHHQALLRVEPLLV